MVWHGVHPFGETLSSLILWFLKLHWIEFCLPYSIISILGNYWICMGIVFLFTIMLSCNSNASRTRMLQFKNGALQYICDNLYGHWTIRSSPHLPQDIYCMNKRIILCWENFSKVKYKPSFGLHSVLQCNAHHRVHCPHQCKPFSIVTPTRTNSEGKLQG